MSDDMTAKKTGIVTTLEEDDKSTGAVPGGTLIRCREVRFFKELARHGVHLAALVYHVSGWITSKESRKESAVYWNTLDALGSCIGVSGKQVSRLLKQACELDILDYRSDYVNGELNTFIRFKTTSWRRKEADENKFGYYDLDLVEKAHGVTGALLLSKIAHSTLYVNKVHPVCKSAKGSTGGYAFYIETFPWMTKNAVRSAFYHLRKHGLVNWTTENSSRGCRDIWVENLDAQAPNDARMDRVTATDYVRKALGLKFDTYKKIFKREERPSEMVKPAVPVEPASASEDTEEVSNTFKPFKPDNRVIVTEAGAPDTEQNTTGTEQSAVKELATLQLQYAWLENNRKLKIEELEKRLHALQAMCHEERRLRNAPVPAKEPTERAVPLPPRSLIATVVKAP